MYLEYVINFSDNPRFKLSLDIVYYAIQFILLCNFDELEQAVLTLPSENKLVISFGIKF